MRKQQKEVNQIRLLQNQVQSLKEIISIMEKEVVRNAANHDAQKQLTLSLVLEKWRAKVFEYLVATKRYELVIRDNLSAYNEEKATMKSTITDLQTQTQLLTTKINTLVVDN